jgi:hypothetical protein
MARWIPESIANARDLASLAGAYIVVKALMPFRIGLCLFLVPRMVKGWEKVVNRIKL